jgi:uncharacterized protein (DUF2236 family)
VTAAVTGAPSAHDGCLGPDSVAWRVVGHPGALVGGLRALMCQALHPLAMAGVAQHSDYRNRSLDRLRRTSYYVAATVFGDRATAEEAAARVRRIHARVRGTDPVTGRPYSADDPATQAWVHCVEWHSFLAAHRVFGPALSAGEEDRYVAEGVPIATLVGTPEELVPRSVAEMRDYFARVRPELRASEHARGAIDFVLTPPLSNAALALVPRELRRLAGVDRPRAIDAAAIAAARPVVASLALPGPRDLMALVIGRESRDVRLAAERRAVAA